MFDKEELNHHLGRLEATEIVDIDVDLKNHRIEFKIIDHWGEESRPRQLVFGDVASFYYVAGRHSSSRFDKPINEMLELSEIGYTGGDLDKITHTFFNPNISPIEPLSPNSFWIFGQSIGLLKQEQWRLTGNCLRLDIPTKQIEPL